MPGYPIQAMRNIVRSNGHLVLQGDETKDDLLEALINLRHYHPDNKCRRPQLGTPIQILIPDTATLYLSKAVRRRPVTDIETKRL
jgi:hypothetical protein